MTVASPVLSLPGRQNHRVSVNSERGNCTEAPAPRLPRTTPSPPCSAGAVHAGERLILTIGPPNYKRKKEKERNGRPLYVIVGVDFCLSIHPSISGRGGLPLWTERVKATALLPGNSRELPETPDDEDMNFSSPGCLCSIMSTKVINAGTLQRKERPPHAARGAPPPQFFNQLVALNLI